MMAPPYFTLLYPRIEGSAIERRKKSNRIFEYASALPIYEQITQQIKDAILSGRLEEGTLLPGIRSLANELHVSVITTKRAYADLEEAGFVTSVQGKGTYVAGGNLEMLREEHLRSLEEQLSALIAEAKSAAVSKRELHELLDLLMDD